MEGVIIVDLIVAEQEAVSPTGGFHHVEIELETVTYFNTPVQASLQSLFQTGVDRSSDITIYLLSHG